MKNFQRLSGEQSKKGRENNFLQIRKEKKLEHQGTRRAALEVDQDSPAAQADRARREAEHQEIVSRPMMQENSAYMKSGDPSLMRQALGFYRQILSRPATKESELMDVLLSDGLLPYIYEFITNFESPGTQIDAVWCITNLACGSPQILDALHRINVAPLLVDMLRHIPSENSGKVRQDLRDHCLWALANLCAEKEDIRQSVIAKDITSTILEDLGLKISLSGRVRPDSNPSLLSLRYMTWILCNIGKSLQYELLECLPEIIEGLAFLIQLDDPHILVDSFRFIACYCLESSNEAIVTTSLESMLEFGIFSRIMIVLNKEKYYDSSKSASHDLSDSIKPLVRTNDVRFFAVRALAKALILGDIRQKCGMIVASRTLADSYPPLHVQLAIDVEYYTSYRLQFVDKEDEVIPLFKNDPNTRNRPNGTKLGTQIAMQSGDYLTSSTPISILRDVDATIISLLKAIRSLHPLDGQFLPSLLKMPSQLSPDSSLGQIIFQNVIQILNRGLSNNVKTASSFVLCLFLSSDEILKETCDNLCRSSDPRAVAVDIRTAVKDALTSNDIELLATLLVSADKVIKYFARLQIQWVDGEFLDKISFFIHYKNIAIQKAASDIQATIDMYRLDDH